MSGLIADARTLVDHARVETQVFLVRPVKVALTVMLLLLESLVYLQREDADIIMRTVRIRSCYGLRRRVYGKPSLKTFQNRTSAFLVGSTLRRGIADRRSGRIWTSAVSHGSFGHLYPVSGDTMKSSFCVCALSVHSVSLGDGHWLWFRRGANAAPGAIQ